MNIVDLRKKTFLIETIIILLPISLLFSNFISEILILILVGIFFINVKKNELIDILNNKIIISIFILYFFLIINYFLNFYKNPDFLRTFFFI